MCTPVFTAALFIITKTWKQPKCPLTDEQVKKTWYMYTMDYQTIKKNEIMPFVVTWVIILSEVNQAEKEKYQHNIAYMQDLFFLK